MPPDDPPPSARDIIERATIDMAEYTPRAVVQAVGASWDPPREGRWVQLVLRPSFDPEVVITAWEQGDATVGAVQTAQCSLWALHKRSLQPADPRWLTQPAPQPQRATSKLPGGVIDPVALWADAERASTQAAVRRSLGLDGISITVRVRLRGDLREHDSWTPSPDAVDRPLIDHLLGWAVAVEDSRLVDAALAIRAYFGT